MRILAIESSCDETAMAVTDSHGVVCASVVATSIDFHARFGGVVPEIASRKHTEAIVGVYEETMAKAGAHFGVDTLVPADLAAVLQPYVRLEDSRNRGTGGTGLGLAIASELAKALGGRLVLGPRMDGAQGLEARVELPEVLPA